MLYYKHHLLNIYEKKCCLFIKCQNYKNGNTITVETLQMRRSVDLKTWFTNMININRLKSLHLLAKALSLRNNDYWRRLHITRQTDCVMKHTRFHCQGTQRQNSLNVSHFHWNENSLTVINRTSNRNEECSLDPHRWLFQKYKIIESYSWW